MSFWYVAGSLKSPDMYEIRWSNHFQSSGWTLVVANWPISSPSCLRKSSELISTLLTPTIANLSGNSLLASRLYSDGIKSRLVKSPVAPKMTNTHGSPGFPRAATSDAWAFFGTEVDIALTLSGFFLEVAAEFVAHRGQQLVRKVGRAARVEAFVECGGQHVRGDAFVDSRVDRPAALA